MRFHGLRFQLSWVVAALLLSGAGGTPAFAQNAEHAEGSHVFLQSSCFVCHGQMGQGGAGPRFREDLFLGITDYVVAQILIGRSIMPSFANKLNDQQIAAVATYIRNSWGNDFGEVKPEEVAKVRKQVQQAKSKVESKQAHAEPQGAH